jgi:hypothetical protein
LLFDFSRSRERGCGFVRTGCCIGNSQMLTPPDDRGKLEIHIAADALPPFMLAKCKRIARGARFVVASRARALP